MTFKSLFGPITKLSLSFVTFRVSHFPVLHLTYVTVKLGLQNTLNMSKTTRVYFGVLHTMDTLVQQTESPFTPEVLHYPLLELANRAGGSGWAEPTPGQENNRADRAGPDLNRAAISLTQPILYRASGPTGQPSPM